MSAPPIRVVEPRSPAHHGAVAVRRGHAVAFPTQSRRELARLRRMLRQFQPEMPPSDYFLG